MNQSGYDPLSNDDNILRRRKSGGGNERGMAVYPHDSVNQNTRTNVIIITSPPPYKQKTFGTLKIIPPSSSGQKRKVKKTHC